MKKIDLKNKLQLRRETVRALTKTELQAVVGGVPNGDEQPPPGSFATGNQCGTRP